METPPDKITVYVSENGSDDNDGLTPSAPKATINNAIKEAPLHKARQPRLTIKCSGKIVVPDSSEVAIDLRTASVNSIEIIGKSDSNGDPKVTIDANGGSHGLAADAVNVLLKDIIITNADSLLSLRYNAAGNLDNCWMIAGPNTTKGAYITWGATMAAGRNCLFDLTPSETGTNWTIAATFGEVRIGATCIGENIQIKEGGRAFIGRNATIDAGGERFAVRVYWGSHAKISSCEIRNASVGLRVEGNSTISMPSVPTFTDVTKKYSGSTSGLLNQRNGQSWIYNATQGNDPDIEDMDSPVGAFYHNIYTGKFTFYSNHHGGWMETGRLPRNKGTITVEANGETSLTSINAFNRLYSLEWHVVNEYGTDWDLTEGRRNGGDGLLEYYITNTGTSAVDVRYILYELERG